jgi:hypothetical protein
MVAMRSPVSMAVELATARTMASRLGRLRGGCWAGMGHGSGWFAIILAQAGFGRPPISDVDRR